MRTIRTLFLIPLTVISAFFLFEYVRAVAWMWEARDAPGIHLLIEPHVCVYRAFTHGHGERDGWTPLLLTDPPEGTRAVFYFPSWPFAVAAVGTMAYGASTIFDKRERHVIRPFAASPDN